MRVSLSGTQGCRRKESAANTGKGSRSSARKKKQSSMGRKRNRKAPVIEKISTVPRAKEEIKLSYSLEENSSNQNFKMENKAEDLI
ncbi:hypothetical protein TNCT_212951 [Trichonephila clavata]|uniref:Uncharacterized protein n=1 Tax=Trichonephila clavata TaxID=2740835 RepID=A0A8X6LSI1_TRICU|nr:hypothetical protein TNCT_212951 [Trichonephila clavata]